MTRYIEFGEFSLYGNDAEVMMTISQKLDKYPFPNSIGETVSVQLVIPDDDDAYLEVHPSGD